MTIASRVQLHPRTSSVLISTIALAAGACGMSAPQKASPGFAHNSMATSSPPPSSAIGASSGDSYHAATESRGAYDAPAEERPGLGTQWGESVNAPISFAPFTRASSSPWAQAVLHYNDANGVSAHAAYVGSRPSPLEVYAGDGSIGIALVDDYGRTLPGYQASGRSLIIGEDGARYRIVVRNGTSARFEVVASVDGLDVIDGKPADPNRRGYIVNAHDTLVIEGFRTSDDEVAAFRFGKVADSYAAQTSGDRNVGVIGFAIFAERGAVWTPAELGRRDSADPFPNRGYAVPPR